MALHPLSSFTYQVPNVAEVSAYYRDFGLTDNGDGSFSTVEGGRQLHIEQGPLRKISAIEIGADDPDDLSRIAASLKTLGVDSQVDGTSLLAVEPIMKVAVRVSVQDRLVQESTPVPPMNGPGSEVRVNERAAGPMRNDQVRPRRLGHIAFISGEAESSLKFFMDGLGFKLSDHAGTPDSAFMRCSSDHHNVAVLPGPTNFPHHSAWQVDDVDDIGRGAEDMLTGNEERAGWGFGRHYAGSNFFWYLKDPVGTYSEYYADMDQISEDDLWTPQLCEGKSGFYRWGPAVPPEFMNPRDLAELIAAQND